MSEIPKGPEWTAWLDKLAKRALTIEQILQIFYWEYPVERHNEVIFLVKTSNPVNEQTMRIRVDAAPLNVASLHDVARLTIDDRVDDGEMFVELIKELLADVDQAIRLLGGKPESREWGQRDVLGILAEAKAYQNICADLGKLSRRTKQKVFYHLKGDLGKAKSGRPPALTEDEKTSLLAEYDRSRLTQAEFVDLKGISRSRLNRLLRERSATR